MDTLLPPNVPIDLTNCDREPIHIPGRIQPFGMLVVLSRADLTMLQVSANMADWLAVIPEDLLGRPVDVLLGAEEVATLRAALVDDQLHENPLYVWTVTLPASGERFDCIAHTLAETLVLELEPARPPAAPLASDAYRAVRQISAALQAKRMIDVYADLLAAQVRSLTGFDRVMIYRFQLDGTGVVIAEALLPGCEAFLGLHYPASDIPQQARALYLRNWLRLVPTVDYTPVALIPDLNPLTGQPLDMSYTVLRSVSPVHLEYLVNMGVRASMSISLVVDGRLWGLIACHHETGPRSLPYDLRTACEFLGRFASAQIADLQHREEDVAIIQRVHIHAALIERVATSTSLAEGFAQGLSDLHGFVDSLGVAVLTRDGWLCAGVVPSERVCNDLRSWLAQQREPIVASESLARDYPPLAAESASASGLLALSLSPSWQSCILWFRPEVIQTVTWGGDPAKPMEPRDDGLRMSPRKSFVAWQEQVRQTARLWTPGEIAAARVLRAALVTILLHQAELLAQHTDELARSNAELEDFAYIASHDLREPLRGIHNYAGILLEDQAGRLDGEAQAQLGTITRLTQRMEALIESLLTYSRVGRLELAHIELDLNELVQHTRDSLRVAFEESGATLRIPRPLPCVLGDPVRLAEVLHNLVGNALKYNDKPERWVELSFQEVDTPVDAPPMVVIAVRDNGIGIAPEYAQEVFRLFRRLHARAAYGGGIGAGLTIARRIIERHGGHMWLESTVSEGTTFWFTLPTVLKE